MIESVSCERTCRAPRATARRGPLRPTPEKGVRLPSITPWWHHAAGYQIYLRSFADRDGDGVGDLAGLRDHLDHVASLGVDLVWISPCFSSPQADHGYDVADYTDVDPLFGDLAALDAVLQEAHAHGLKVVLDLVPNHSSDQHPWFRAARRSVDDPHRDYYVWRDPAPDGGPPNNWVSHFGGPAWTLDEASGQYYLHLFLPEQPDLNWANPAVADEFDTILAFWFERGVDGFRIDVAHSLVKDPGLRDNPRIKPLPPPGRHPAETFFAYEHRHDLDQDEVLDIYRRWRPLADEHHALLMGEVYLLDPERVGRYVAGDDGLHTAFCFLTLRAAWKADELRHTLADAVAASHGRFVWPLSSHDDPRAASRLGDGTQGRTRQLAYATLLAGLPGMFFLLQGDELGLPDGEVSRPSDPMAVRNRGSLGRDGARTPMPWTPDPPGWGFTDGDPWLGIGRNRTPEDTVAVQEADPDSHLHRMRRLLAVRRELADLVDAPVEWLAPDADHGDLVAYRRGDVVVAANAGASPASLALDGPGWSLTYATGGASVTDGRLLRLPPDEAAIVTRPDM